MGNFTLDVPQAHFLEPNFFLQLPRVHGGRVSFVVGGQRRSSRRGMQRPERLRLPMEQRKRVR